MPWIVPLKFVRQALQLGLHVHSHDVAPVNATVTDLVTLLSYGSFRSPSLTMLLSLPLFRTHSLNRDARMY